MRPLAELEVVFDEPLPTPDIQASAAELLKASEEVLEHWLCARGDEPTLETREGFRLLALHRQGATGDPSFNACRETCREIVYHFNLVTLQPEHSDITDRLSMMALVSKHLYLFVSGKLQVAGLGEFCCAAKPIRAAMDNDSTTREEA